MKKLFFLSICILFLTSGKSSVTTKSTNAKIPHIKSTVMLDGRLEKGEWDKALQIQVTDSLQLLVQQDKENIYFTLANSYKQSTLMMVYFYMQDSDNALLNLHASAKLGERKLTEADYGDWVWWNNQDWYANIARLNAFETRTFIYDEAKEFQLRKSRFKQDKLRLMLDVSYPPQRSTLFPANASPTNPENWLELRLR